VGHFICELERGPFVMIVPYAFFCMSNRYLCGEWVGV